MFLLFVVQILESAINEQMNDSQQAQYLCIKMLKIAQQSLQIPKNKPQTETMEK